LIQLRNKGSKRKRHTKAIEGRSTTPVRLVNEDCQKKVAEKEEKVDQTIDKGTRHQ
jgi:hypothetical protein